MHATHQFFLTKRTLYLLVIDCRENEQQNRIEYWLQIIQSFAAESPVIIVGNQCDQKTLDIDEVGLRKKYPTIKAICSTSCPDPPLGMDDLKRAVIDQIDTMPFVRDPIPNRYFAVQDLLEKMERNYTPYDDYVRM